MPLDIQCRMYTYEPNTADVIRFVRKISPHIKSYTRLMLPSAITVGEMSKNKNDNENENENVSDNENENERLHETKVMNENRRNDYSSHTQFKLNSNSHSFDSPSDMRKMKKTTSISSGISNKIMRDVRGYGQDDDVPQGKKVKTKTNVTIKKAKDKRAVRGTKTKTKTKSKAKAGVKRECTCHPIAWTLITSSCLSRGKKCITKSLIFNLFIFLCI